MRTAEISEIASLLENYDETTQPFILMRNGQPIAVLFPVEDIDLETLSLNLNPQFASIIKQSRSSQEEAGRVFLADISLSSEP